MRQLPYWTLLTALFLAFLVIVYALLYGDEEQPRPIRNTYYPFTVELEVWDVGASPWDHKDRPTDLDK